MALLAPDGYELIDELIDLAGPAAEGMYISTFGLLNSRLTPRGARFLDDLEAASGRRTERSLSAAYAAQATEILLDAIARSDGTRASVTTELLRTRVEDGLLGDLRFDERGDLVEAPVTILRVVGKGHPESEPGYAGAVVDRVVIARGALLRDGASS